MSPRTSTWRAIVAAMALVLGMNALGHLARAFPEGPLQLTGWLYRVGLEQLTLPVMALMVLVVAYVLALGRAGRANWGSEARISPRRKLLPPVELLLLQIGNVTFLGFAVVLLAMILTALGAAVRSVVTSPLLTGANFTIHLVVAIVVTAIAAGLRARGRRSDGERPGVGPRWPGIFALAVGGFGIIPMLPENGFLKLDLTASELGALGLGTLYAVSVASWMLYRSRNDSRLGKGPDAELRQPRRGRRWLIVLAWIASVGTLTLVLQGAFLTLFAHVAASGAS